VKEIDFNKRYKKFDAALKEQQIDLFLGTPSINFGYLFKGFINLSERLICSIVLPGSNSYLLAPAFEKDRMLLQTTFDEVVTWQEDEDPYSILKNLVLKDIKTIAIEPTMPFEVFYRIKKLLPEKEFVDGGSIIKKLRSVKSLEEIERMKKAAVYTKNGILSAISQLEEGQTELNVLELVLKEMTILSGEPSWALVQFDENSAIPHGHASKKKLKQGSVVLIDAGTSCEHYFADITVTTVFGKASPKFLEVYEVVEEANEKALETSKVGIIAEEVDTSAREVIRKAGYGNYFTHRLGHGLGLEVHEEPYIVQGNKTALVEGNVHTDEPGIYLPGKFGVRIEDDILVNKTSQRLVTFDRHIWK